MSRSVINEQPRMKYIDVNVTPDSNGAFGINTTTGGVVTLANFVSAIPYNANNVHLIPYTYTNNVICRAYAVGTFNPWTTLLTVRVWYNSP